MAAIHMRRTLSDATVIHKELYKKTMENLTQRKINRTL